MSEVPSPPADRWLTPSPLDRVRLRGVLSWIVSLSLIFQLMSTSDRYAIEWPLLVRALLFLGMIGWFDSQRRTLKLSPSAVLGSMPIGRTLRLGAVAGVSFTLFALGCVELIAGIVGYSPSFDPGGATSVLTSVAGVRCNAAIIITLCVLAPIAEEVVFREAALRRFGVLFGTAWAPTTTAFLFAVLHGEVLVPFAFSLFLSTLRIRSSSLLLCIIAHAVTNAAVLAWTSQAHYLPAVSPAGMRPMAFLVVATIGALGSREVVRRSSGSNLAKGPA